MYLKDIESDNNGEEYTSKTIAFLKELAKKKLGVNRNDAIELEEVKLQMSDRR